MNYVLKLICLSVFALAILALLGALPAHWVRAVLLSAAGLLLVHTVEVFFAFKHVRSYPGPLWISIVLTLLFGLLHWRPLARANAAAKGAVRSA
jgi:uncharacterized protein YhhL (DUF1145 family)